jgi:ClpP class serine protease/uncharacterized coiled-coil DUF342 family protein
MINFTDLYCHPTTVLDVLADMDMYNQGNVDKDFFLKKSQEEGQPTFVSFHNGAPIQAAASNLKPSSANRVAVIPIKGMMQRRYNYAHMATSTEFVRMQIELANQMPDVRAIVLDITSGGGTVSGTYELAEAVRNSNKPVIAAITDLGASAAYWVASAASEVYVTNPLTQVGSIGAITQHQSFASALEKAGIDIKFITSKNAAAKAYGNFAEPLEGDALKAIQKSLNDAEKHFHSAIRRTRGSVLNEDAAFTGEIFSPEVSRDIGLIDGVKKMDRILGRALTIGNKHYQEEKNKKKSNSIKYNAMNTNTGIGAFAEFLPNSKPRFSENVELSAQEATDLYDALDNLKSGNVEAKAKIETLEGEVAEANTKIAGLVAEVEAANAATADAKTQIEEAKAEVTARNEKIEELNTRISELEAASTESDSEAATKLAEVEAQLETANENLATANTEKEEASNKVTELTAKVEELEGTINANAEEVTELKVQLANAVTENNRLARQFGARSRVAIQSGEEPNEGDNNEEFASNADRAVATRDLDNLFALNGKLNLNSFIN